MLMKVAKGSEQEGKASRMSMTLARLSSTSVLKTEVARRSTSSFSASFFVTSARIASCLRDAGKLSST